MGSGYTAWWNWFLGIDSWAPYKFKNSGSEFAAFGTIVRLSYRFKYDDFKNRKKVELS